MQYSNEPADQPEEDLLAVNIRALLDQPPAPTVDANIRQTYRDILGQAKPVKLPRPGAFRQLRDLLTSQHRSLLFGTVGASLLLGVTTGLLLSTVWKNTESDQSVGAELLQTRGALTPSASATHLAMPAEEWLESIAELLLQGQVGEARKQLAQFEAHYRAPIYTKGAQK